VYYFKNVRNVRLVKVVNDDLAKSQPFNLKTMVMI
jgi:hypothetical protein